MTDPVDRAFHALRLEYLDSLPALLEELRSDVARLRGGDPEAHASLKVRLHRLAGSGGSYGFVHLSSIAREAEKRLASPQLSTELDHLEEVVQRLAKTAHEANAEMSRRLHQ